MEELNFDPKAMLVDLCLASGYLKSLADTTAEFGNVDFVDSEEWTAIEDVLDRLKPLFGIWHPGKPSADLRAAAVLSALRTDSLIGYDTE